jgi:ABC-type antimicrobial peptide transport system permease subunit
LKEIQQAVWSVNPNLPVASVRTLDEILSRSMAQTSFALVMLGIAAAVALVLGVVGIYGVISYVATQRTREIGIRMALGSDAAAILRLILNEAAVLVMLGLAAGFAGAIALRGAIAAQLYGVGALDPVVMAGAVAILAATSLVACLGPARRAVQVSPLVALSRQ